jgi:hypothetical protein
MNDILSSTSKVLAHFNHQYASNLGLITPSGKEAGDTALHKITESILSSKNRNQGLMQ